VVAGEVVDALGLVDEEVLLVVDVELPTVMVVDVEEVLDDVVRVAGDQVNVVVANIDEP
jgi:hypothetical protein